MDDNLILMIILILIITIFFIYKLTLANWKSNRTSRRLSQIYKKSTVIYYTENHQDSEDYKDSNGKKVIVRDKIVMMSDCHRGVGDSSDNFLKNQHLFYAALDYYNENGFTYIELGDGDELWENRSIEKIKEVHSDCLWLMYKFYRKNRMYMLYGNHDMVKKNKKFVRDSFSKYYYEAEKKTKRLFPGIRIHEGLILEDKNNKKNRILLVHGNQGDLINDRLAKLGRFLVRYFWRSMERLGFNDPTGAGKNVKKKGKVERRLMKWSEENDVMIIAGHTHRPMFPYVGEGMYFNDGSCVHPRCITALEIENGKISLVKWVVKTNELKQSSGKQLKSSMYVAREILEGPSRLDDYFNNKVSQ